MTVTFKKTALSIFPVLITAVLCSYFTRTGVSNWFGQASKTMIIPPNYVFSVAWSLIYILMMISVYRILSRTTPDHTPTFRYYWQQLVLQVLWCGLFFYAREPLIAGLVILWLLFTVFKMIRSFLKTDVIAGILNYFYFLYLCFAVFLNFAFLYNTGAIGTF